MVKGDCFIFLNSIKSIRKELNSEGLQNQNINNELSAMENVINKYYLDHYENRQSKKS